MQTQSTEITNQKPVGLQASLDKREIKLEDFRVIKEILYPNVQKDETLLMAIDYCRARKLDIMKRTIQIVPIWDNKLKAMKDTIWPSISEVRITATRTGQYAGRSEAEFGDEVTENLGGIEVTYPKWCRVTVFRLVQGEPRSFTAKLFWKQEYKTQKNDTAAPNAMWAKRNYAQLEKCCEAAALRMAFPEEVGNDYIGEETFDANEGMLNITPKSKTAQAHAVPPALERSFNVSELKSQPQVQEAELIDSDASAVNPPFIDQEQSFGNPEQLDTSREEAIYEQIKTDLETITTLHGIKRNMENHANNMAILHKNAPTLFENIRAIEKRRLEVLK